MWNQLVIEQFVSYHSLHKAINMPISYNLSEKDWHGLLSKKILVFLSICGRYC